MAFLEEYMSNEDNYQPCVYCRPARQTEKAEYLRDDLPMASTQVSEHACYFESAEIMGVRSSVTIMDKARFRLQEV